MTDDALEAFLSKFEEESRLPTTLDPSAPRTRDELSVAEINRVAKRYDRIFEHCGDAEDVRRSQGIKERLRQLYEVNPSILWLPPEEFMDGGIFEDMDPTPAECDVKWARAHLLEGFSLGDAPGFPHRSDCHAGSSPTEDFGALHTATELRSVLVREPRYVRELDPGKLADAVVGDSFFFVPTVDEIIEARRLIRPALPFVPSPPKAQNEVRPEASNQTSELEKAVVRALRAPLQNNRRGRGYWKNPAQEWMGRRGMQLPKLYNYSVCATDVAAGLKADGFLATEPSERDVEEVLRKLLKEVREAARRRKSRLRRKTR